jgi:hypothetical protein
MSPDYTPALESRFFRKVSIDDGCWEWLGGKISRGYGAYYPNKHTVYAHRYMWEALNGPIPAGLFVCHHCDNPSCVRPDHLFLGTHRDNMHDMRSKGHGNTTLTEDDVRLIRQCTDHSWSSCQQLGVQFGVTPENIQFIITGRTWKHILSI